MAPHETFQHNGYTVKIQQDTDAEAPQQEKAAFLLTTNNRHFCPKLPDDISVDRNDPEAIREVLGDTYHLYPLYAYIHGGVALSMSRTGQFADRWDGGQIGVVAVTKDTSDIPSPEEYAEAHIEEWNQYLSGDVWGYVIEDGNGVHVDSCWGFYGLDYCRTEAKANVPDLVTIPLVRPGDSTRHYGAGI